jgi:hypothetical protein
VVKAKIEIEEIEGSIKVMELLKIYQKLYKVYPSVIKKNNINNNQSNNAQEGLFSLQPSENKICSQINLGKGDEVCFVIVL